MTASISLGQATEGQQVLLSRTASSDAETGISGYEVYRNDIVGPIGTTTLPTYRDNTVSLSSTYTYTVIAIDRAAPPNYSAPSALLEITTLPANQVYYFQNGCWPGNWYQ